MLPTAWSSFALLRPVMITLALRRQVCERFQADASGRAGDESRFIVQMQSMTTVSSFLLRGC